MAQKSSAVATGKSLNQWAIEVLNKAAHAQDELLTGKGYVYGNQLGLCKK